MRFDKSYISEKFREIIQQEGFLFIELIIRGDHNQRIVEVFIDNESGITTEDCSRISRLLNEVIEKEELFDKYRLDVSSPGVDRPLKYLQQFNKHLNRKFEVKYLEGEETKKISGKLIDINGDVLTFLEGKSENQISYDKIKSAKVLISF